MARLGSRRAIFRTHDGFQISGIEANGLWSDKKLFYVCKAIIRHRRQPDGGEVESLSGRSEGDVNATYEGTTRSRGLVLHH